MEDIKKGVVFGHVLAHIYIIEFQKRGLLHILILIFLDRKNKIRYTRDMDYMVFTKFQDKDNN